MVLTDAALADCIEQLGDHADNPTTEQLRAVLPGLVERHGIGVTRMMLASTVAGEATAANVIRDLLKHDELVALPKPEPGPPRPSPIIRAPTVSDVERDAIKAKRQELRRKKQAEARAASRAVGPCPPSELSVPGSERAGSRPRRGVRGRAARP